MIRHVLVFRFNEGVEQAARADAIERLEALGEQCPTIASWYIGTNIAESPNASDVIEIGDFANTEALEAYKLHPAHQEFSAHIRTIATYVLLDCEIDPVL